MSPPLLLVVQYLRTLFTCGLLVAVHREGDAATSIPPRHVEIEMREGLRFSPARVVVAPGETILFKVANRDPSDMPHNFVLMQPGARARVVEAALALGEHGPAQNFVPETNDVINSTPVLSVDGRARFTYQFPNTPGIYPFVCTYPGHGMVMFGAVYVGVALPPLADDPNVPPQGTQDGVPGRGRRPYVQRMFLPDSGPASIAVSLPGSQNVAWDAGECRLRYAWQGAFIDAGEHWRGTGARHVTLPAEPWWRSGSARLLQVGDHTGTPVHTQFKGLRWLPDGVSFEYLLSGVRVEERITPARTGPGILITYRVEPTEQPIRFVPAASATVRWLDANGALITKPTGLTGDGVREFSVVLTSPLCAP